MRAIRWAIPTAATIALAMVLGCGGGGEGAVPATPPPMGIDQVIEKLESDSPIQVQMGALDVTATGSDALSAADKKKALPALKAAAKKNWGRDQRVRTAIKQAIRHSEKAK